VGCGGAAVVAGRTSPTPLPRFAGPGETDLVHQARDGLGGKADGSGEIHVDGIVAAGRTDLAGVACEAVGEVDANPFAADAAVGERGAASVGFGAERCRAGGGKTWHGLAGADGEQRGAPQLGDWLQQRIDEYVERAEAYAQAM